MTTIKSSRPFVRVSFFMVECSKQEEKYDEGYFGKSSAVDLMDIRGNHPDKSFCFRTGSKKGQPLLYNGLTDSNGALIVDYYDITLPYPMALAIIFACDSNSGMNVLASQSPNSITLGFSGTLYPFSPWDYVSDVIKPSDQGTNGED